MSVITYKCPNCSSGLSFNPKITKFTCEFCDSKFEEQVLQDIEKEKIRQADREFNTYSQLYSCPNCGAEIITDDTTAATVCVYCHNPVILSGKMEGGFRPDYLIPFSVDKKRATEIFDEWCKNKKFMEDDFHSQKQIDTMQGVYFPFWVVDVKANARLDGTGTNVRTWRSGDYIYTETSTFRIQREGTLDFNDIVLSALRKRQVKILDGVQPYSMSHLKPFDMSFLSGFLAEKRNIEQQDARGSVEQIVLPGGRTALKNSVGSYSSVSYGNISVTPVHEHWLHIMLPAWMLTYRFKGKDYFFAVNGDTGRVTGQVPVSRKKLTWLFTGIAAGLSGLLIFLGWLL